MSCREYKKLIFLFDEATVAEREKIQKHLVTCASCQQVFQSVLVQKEILKGAVPSTRATGVNPVLTTRVLDAIGDQKRERVSYFHRVLQIFDYDQVRYAFAAVSLFLVVFFVVETNYDPAGRFALIRERKPEMERTVTLNSSKLFQRMKQNLESKRIFDDRSLYACVRACQSGQGDDCEDCKTKYSKN